MHIDFQLLNYFKVNDYFNIKQCFFVDCTDKMQTYLRLNTLSQSLCCIKHKPSVRRAPEKNNLF